MANEENVHAGHRARLLELATKAGFENLTEPQAMEVLLTYIFPRGDVNPLAHRLLNEFGSFSAVLEAEPDDLMHIKGINVRSARMLANFRGMFFYYYTSRINGKTVVKNKAEILDIVEEHLRFRTTEYAVMLALSPSNNVIHKKLLRSQTRDDVPVSIHDFTRFLSYSKPKKVVLAHCHPYGSCAPSEADITLFEEYRNICQSCGIDLIDSYIVGEDAIYSTVEDKIVRHLL